MAVDPAKVKELREKTGLPMMECKRALDKAGDDVETAYEELRKAGLKAVEKLAGRSANDGAVGSFVSDDGKTGVLVALRCETEPVAKNEVFQELLGKLVQVVAKENPADAAALEGTKLASGKTVKESLTDLVNQIRENITIGKFVRFETDAAVQYVHFDNKKGAMVALSGGDAGNADVAELGKQLGQHIVFMKPAGLSRDKIDPAVVEKEREIFLAAAKNDPKNAKKPQEIMDKIIGGQVEKFVASQCLLEQAFVRDDKKTVEEYVKSTKTGVTLTDFAYVATDLE